MSPDLMPELLDLIVDHLRGELTTLETCCVVSKSWVPRAQKHLFAHVEFHVELWKKAFPDPSTRHLRYPVCRFRVREYG